MLQIASLLFSIVATAFAGSGVVLVLTLGHATLVPILSSAAAGVVAAVPVTWLVARRLAGRD
jgi:predicted PurR-regulated permease PerM